MNDPHPAVPESPADPQGAGAQREPLEKLAEEFIERRRRGERPAISEYMLRRPDLAAAIASLFPTLIEVEDLGRSRDEEPAIAEAHAPAVLGDFHILREVARGGMGIVYEAEQISLGRRVALKLLSLSRLGDEHLVERFRREARSAAGLHHSNIVPVYGTGEADGALFYAMQFIDGHNLAEVLAEVRRLRDASISGRAVSVSESAATLTGSSSAAPDAGRALYFQRAAAIARKVADALAYAHGEGVLHRDIKPSNLLLDAKGNVWVTDFGLAKAEGSAELTHSGDVVGTLAYLAPERLEGWSDPRSDVYSLGLTLYEMVALRRAFPQSTRAEILQALGRKDPVPPRKVDPTVPRDLETIILKATDKVPARRYSSAREMADDLERFLEIRPIHAKRAGVAHRALRWCQRSPLAASLAATSLVLVAALAVGATATAFHLREERNTAAARLLDTRIASARWRRQAGWSGQRFDSLRELKDVAAARKDSEVTTEAVACFGRFDFEVESSHALESWAAVVAPSFETYAVGQTDGSVTIRKLDDASIVRRIALPAKGRTSINALRFSPSGALLAVGFEGDPPGYQMRVVRVADGQAALRVPSTLNTLALDFEPGETRVAVRGEDSSVEVVSLSDPTAEPIRLLAPGSHRSRRLAFSPSGKQIASCSGDGGSVSVLVLGLEPARVEKILVHDAMPYDVSWHPAGKLLAVACADFMVYLWDVEAEQITRKLRGHKAEVVVVAFSPTGNSLGTSSWDGESRFWDIGTGIPLARGLGRFQAWSPDGRCAAFTSGKQVLGKWRIAPGDEVRRVRFRLSGKGARDLAVSPEGDILAAACDWDGLQVALVSGGGPWMLSTAQALTVAFLPGGAGLIASGEKVVRYPMERSQGVARFLKPVVLIDKAGIAAVSADGNFVALSDPSGAIVLAAVDAATPPRTLTRAHNVSRIAVSRGGRWVAVESAHPPETRVIEGETGMEVSRSAWGGGYLAFSPDGRLLVACSSEAIRAIDVATWSVKWSQPRQEGGSLGGAVVFPADSRYVFAAPSRSQIGLYETAGGREVTRFSLIDDDHIGAVGAGAGSVLAAGSRFEYVQVWDLAQVAHKLSDLGLDLGLEVGTPPLGSAAGSIEVPSGDGPIEPGLVQGSDWSEKVNGWTLLAQAAPGSVEYHERRAEAFLEGGQSQDALVELARALELKPAQPARLRVRRAQVLDGAGQLAESLDELNRGLVIDAMDREARTSRASVLDRMERHEDAVKDLEAVLAKSPGDAGASEALAWILLTGPAGLRDAPRALRCAREAAAARPEAANAQRTLGLACYRAGLLGDARAALEKVRKIPGRDSPPASYLVQALVLAKEKDAKGAAQALEKGIARIADATRRRMIAPVNARRLNELRKEAEREVAEGKSQ